MTNEIVCMQGPFSYLDLAHGQTVIFVPARWEYGSFCFTLRIGKQKTVQGIRIWLSQKVPGGAYRGMPYVDIGQQKLVFQLRPLLDQTVPDLFEYAVTAIGSAPTTEYQVSVRPLPV